MHSPARSAQMPIRPATSNTPSEPKILPRHSSKPPYPARDLGPLPVDLINAVLGTELEPGRVLLSAQAHKHMAEDHPTDYPACIAALSTAIAEPTFIGQAPGISRNFELIRRLNR